MTSVKLIVNISEDVPATTESITEEIFETKDVDFLKQKRLNCKVGKLMKSMRRFVM